MLQFLRKMAAHHKHLSWQKIPLYIEDVGTYFTIIICKNSEKRENNGREKRGLQVKTTDLE
jgi:hypothetical protein